MHDRTGCFFLVYFFAGGAGLLHRNIRGTELRCGGAACWKLWTKVHPRRSSRPLTYPCFFHLWRPLQVTLGPTVLLALVQTAAAFFLAYRVAPTILTLQTGGQQHAEQQQPAGQLPVPLQCDGGLRFEHTALLSCRPLAQQVLLGLAMVAWPVWLSWVVDRRLRRQHAKLCRELERIRRQQGKRELPLADTQQQHQGTPVCSPTTPVGTSSQGGRDVEFGITHDYTSTTATASMPAGAAQPCSSSRLAVVLPSASSTPRPSALYRSSMSSAVVSLKVRRALPRVGMNALLPPAAGGWAFAQTRTRVDRITSAVHGALEMSGVTANPLQFQMDRLLPTVLGGLLCAFVLLTHMDTASGVSRSGARRTAHSMHAVPAFRQT